jgi:hypothetical protein
VLRASITLVRLALSVRLDPARRNPELAEIVTVGDSAVRVAVYVRAFTDGAAVADAQARAFAKALTDAATVTDDLGGQATADDDQTLGFWKSLSHSATLTDAARRDGTKALAHAAAVADVAAKAMTRGAADGASIADSFARAVQFTRDFGLYATLDYFAQDYVQDDIARVADAMVRALARPFSEAASASDAGTALAQGYVTDPFYFAADYVGTARTF